MESHDTLKRKFEANMRERDVDFNRIKELEDTLDTQQSELETLQANMDDRLVEIGALRGQLARKDADGNRRTAELERQVKDKTSEVERLRSRVREIVQQNADQDLKVVSLKKESENQTEVLTQLNIALEAKQQELEMVRALLLSSRCIIDRRVVTRLNGKIPSRALRG
jgi:chromosome segregation ATPase